MTVRICTSLIPAGLFLLFVSQTPIITLVKAEETAEAPGLRNTSECCAAGEALVFVADRGRKDFSWSEHPLLSQAEDLFLVNSTFDPPENEPDQIKGSIKLVKSRTMNTQELIEALSRDDSIIYAEPNYLLEFVCNGNCGDKNDPSCQKKDSGRTEDGQEAAYSQRISAEHEAAAIGQQASKEEADPDLKRGSHSNSVPKERSGKDPSLHEDGQEQKLAPSKFGPSSYIQGQIPDMTEWQWGNWNNGNLAGTWTHSGTVDIQHSKWKTQEELPEYVVAVFDSGIDETNPGLANVLWTGDVFGPGGDSHGFYLSSSSDCTSTTGLNSAHGSHIAGIIAAQANGQGTSGISSNVKLMSLRTDETFASVFS